MKKRTYHRENCDNRIREIITDMLGRTIVLAGKHAFEWSITICSDNTYYKITYKNRIEATKEFNKFKLKR